MLIKIASVLWFSGFSGSIVLRAGDAGKRSQAHREILEFETEINIRLEKLSRGNFIEIKLSHHQTQNSKKLFSLTWEAKKLYLKEKK